MSATIPAQANSGHTMTSILKRTRLLLASGALLLLAGRER